MSRKSSNLFTQTPVNRPNRNLFDLSHEVKMSCKFGFLYPVLCMDVVPGDVVRDQMTAMVRFAPMLSPVMHRVDVTTHFFFVPNRIVSEAWEDFITGGQDGLDTTVLPYLTPNGVKGGANEGYALMLKGTLWDYLGLPPRIPNGGAITSTEQISVLPFRAYTKIWNDYYRDPNLDTEVELDEELEGDVSVSARDYMVLKNRGWEKDYFTSALPWAQRGAEVLMPLSGTGTVTYSPSSTLRTDPSNNFPLSGNLSTSVLDGKIKSGGIGEEIRVENIDSVEIDASDVSINDLRRSLAIQKWLEANARGGGRYIEQIESHFAVRVPDYRLQRAEYLGGGKQPVVISEVLATAHDVSTPVGELAGHGLSVGKSNRFTYRCAEHGHIIGIMSVMPRTAYSQGIDRMWSRRIKYDYAWPELAHLGEQEILSKEAFYDFQASGDSDNQGIFGYIPRYAEYKFKNDRIAGDFRTTLNFWHLGRTFQQRPVLESKFTTMSEDGWDGAGDLEETYRRIFAVEDGTDYLWCQLFHRLTAKRPLPYFGVPTI
jgi:hypothetical protein